MIGVEVQVAGDLGLRQRSFGEPDLDLLRLQIRKTVPTATVDVSAGIQTQSGPVIILSGYVTSRLANGLSPAARS